MNLYSCVVRTMKKSDLLALHHEEIVLKLQTICKEMEDLMDDPLFVDNIHGDQELALDQMLELVDGIKARFQPEVPRPELPYGYEQQQYDVD